MKTVRCIANNGSPTSTLFQNKFLNIIFGNIFPFKYVKNLGKHFCYSFNIQFEILLVGFPRMLEIVYSILGKFWHRVWASLVQKLRVPYMFFVYLT